MCTVFSESPSYNRIINYDHRTSLFCRVTAHQLSYWNEDLNQEPCGSELMLCYPLLPPHRNMKQTVLNNNSQSKNFVMFIFQYVTPGFVSTNMTKNLKANGISVVTAEQLAEQTVNAMGLCTSLVGTWTQELYFAMIHLLPKWLLLKLICKSLSKKVSPKT